MSSRYNSGRDYLLQHRWRSESRALGSEAPAKDRIVCGSCSSLGTAGAYFVKIQNARGDGKLLRLLYQQVVD